MIVQPLRPLNPSLHAAYVAVLHPPAGKDPLPADQRQELDRLVARRNCAPAAEIDTIESAIVARTWWYAIRPDQIARDILRHWRWRSPLTVDQATVVLLAIAEAGYPITGNGAPDYPYEMAQAEGWSPPVRGEERERVLTAAARYWAEQATRHITYISLGDARGYQPRPVQYDQPGSMHPGQRAALTLGPASDTRSHAYMSRHTRRLLLVRDGGTD